MRNIKLRAFFSAICIASVVAGFTTANAAPIRFDQVVQVINARPERANSITQLCLAGDYSFGFGDDDDKKTAPAKPQDDRVITETRSDIIKDDVCDCEEAVIEHRGFPAWALLGLAAIPIAFLITHDHDKTPSPTGTPNLTPSGTATPHTTASTAPSSTPSSMPTPMTPPPTPPTPTPEPVTILLFGTGLASIGFAARRKYG